MACNHSKDTSNTKSEPTKKDTSFARVEKAQQVAAQVKDLMNDREEKLDSILGKFSITDYEWQRVKSYMQDQDDSIRFLNSPQFKRDTIIRWKFIHKDTTILDTLYKDTTIWDVNWETATEEDWKEWRKKRRRQ